jgi:hypothetical protein
MSNYADIEYADSYFMTRLNTAVWDDAVDADKTKALTMATEAIDRLNFLGCKYDAEQENQFPRDDDTVIPADIKKACCLIAFALLDGVDPEKEFENLFVSSNSFGGVRTTFDRPPVAAHIAAGIPSYRAWTLMFPYLRDPANLKLRRVD